MNPYHDSIYAEMNAADNLDKTSDLFFCRFPKNAARAFLWFAVRAAVFWAGLWSLYFKILPAVNKSANSAILSGLYVTAAFAATLLFLEIFLTVMSKSANILAARRTILNKRPERYDVLRTAPAIFIMTVIGIIASATAAGLILFPTAIIKRRDLFSAVSSLYSGGPLPASLYPVIAAVVAAALLVWAILTLFSMSLPIYLFEGRPLTAFAANLRLYGRSCKKVLKLFLFKGIWTAFYVSLIIAVTAALGAVIKPPAVSVNQFIYDAIFFGFRATFAIGVLSPLAPVTDFITTTFYAVCRAGLDEKFADRLTRKTPYADIPNKRGVCSKTGRYRPAGEGSRFASILTDFAISSVFTASTYMTAKAIATNNAEVTAIAKAAAALIVFALYYTLSLLIFKTTIGRKLLKLKVVRREKKRLIIVGK